jgi:hypothetical protein
MHVLVLRFSGLRMVSFETVHRALGVQLLVNEGRSVELAKVCHEGPAGSGAANEHACSRYVCAVRGSWRSMLYKLTHPHATGVSSRQPPNVTRHSSSINLGAAFEFGKGQNAFHGLRCTGVAL